MDKIFKVFSAVVGGGLSWLYGGFDTLLISLIVLIVLDYITGIIKAVVNKQLSSEVGFRGIARKVVILIIVALGVVVQRSVAPSAPIRDMLITFFIANEALSIIENAAVVLPGVVPTWLVKLLQQVKDDSDKPDTNEFEKDDEELVKELLGEGEKKDEED